MDDYDDKESECRMNVGNKMRLRKGNREQKIVGLGSSVYHGQTGMPRGIYLARFVERRTGVRRIDGQREIS